MTELEELARDSGRADTGGTTETVVARLDPATRITEGENARLWVDGRKLHVFDPASGGNLTLGGRGAGSGGRSGTSPAPASPARPAGDADTDGAARWAEADVPAGRARRSIDPVSGADPGRRTGQLIPARLPAQPAGRPGLLLQFLR